MAFYRERPGVRIRYEQDGTGFPLLLISGGGLNSTKSPGLRTGPFNAIDEFKGEYRLHLGGFAQRHSRPVFGPAGNRPAMGFATPTISSPYSITSASTNSR